MKNIRSLLMLLLLMAVGLNSCQKDIVFVEGSGPGGSGGQQVSFKAKIDGVLLECPIASATFYPASAGMNALQIAGSKGNEGFGFTIFDYQGVGSYNLGDITKANGVYLKDSTDPLNSSYLSSTGTLVISSVTSTYIKGTFSFKGSTLDGKEKTITEGSFVISLAPVVVPPPAAGDKSMSAKINGTLMSFTAEGNYIKSASAGNIMTVIGVNGVQSMIVSIIGYTGVGEYEIDVKAQGSYHTDQTFAGIYDTVTGVKTGKVNITSATSTTIKGTFNFSAPNADPSISGTKTITEGNFDVKYATVTTP